MELPNPELSRRRFVLVAASTLLSAEAALAQGRALTAAQAVARIRAAAGLPWRDRTVDGFKAGDPETVVTGVATTALATVDVLRRAADAGRNLVVTLEPTFYNAADDPGARAADPVVAAKRALIQERRIVVWRFSDHWKARPGAARTLALSDALGGAPVRDPSDPALHTLPEAVPVRDVIARARETLGVRGGLRLVGDPAAPIRRISIVPGVIDLATATRELRRADLLVTGEAREWEGVEYAFDSWSAGERKALLTLGRVVSEEPGMRACAAWLRTVLPELPVEAFAVGDPYWSPAP